MTPFVFSPWTSDAEHLREEFVRQGDVVAVDTIGALQQPGQRRDEVS
jgi:hypothetical protein